MNVNNNIPFKCVTIIHGMWLLWRWIMSNCLTSFPILINLLFELIQWSQCHFYFHFIDEQNWGIVCNLQQVTKSVFRHHALSYYMELPIVLLVRFDWQKVLANLLMNPLNQKHICVSGQRSEVNVPFLKAFNFFPLF